MKEVLLLDQIRKFKIKTFKVINLWVFYTYRNNMAGPACF